MRYTLISENKERGWRGSPDLELDFELAKVIVEGEGEARERALKRFIDRHFTGVYRYVLARTGAEREAEARAIVQATFDYALRHLGNYARGKATVPARLWLLGIANRQFAPRMKRVVRSTKPGAELSDPTILHDSMLRLPPQQGAAMTLALVEQMSPEEIAAALGTSQTKAMKLLRAGLKRAGVRVDEMLAREARRG